MTRGLKGLGKLQRTLNIIKDPVRRKATKAGINAGLVPLTRAMRAAVNATNASPELKREARKTIAKRLKRAGSGNCYGKAGFAVGKRASKKGKPTKKQQAASARAADKGKKGVGISANNVHWFVLGTEERYTGVRKHTGRIPDILGGLLGPAAASAGPAMLAAARAKITQVLAREAAKAKTRKG